MGDTSNGGSRHEGPSENPHLGTPKIRDLNKGGFPQRETPIKRNPSNEGPQNEGPPKHTPRSPFLLPVPPKFPSPSHFGGPLLGVLRGSLIIGVSLCENPPLLGSLILGVPGWGFSGGPPLWDPLLTGIPLYLGSSLWGSLILGVTHYWDPSLFGIPHYQGL